jgi:ribonuclease-3
VLALVVTERLWEDAADDSPGALSQGRAPLVSTRGLAGWAVRLGLPALLRLGRGEERDGGRGKESILATAFEAVVAALYLEAGLGAVHELVAGLMGGEVSTG